MIINLDIPSETTLQEEVLVFGKEAGSPARIDADLSELKTKVKKSPEELIKAHIEKSKCVINNRQIEQVMPHLLEGLNQVRLSNLFIPLS